MDWNKAYYTPSDENKIRHCTGCDEPTKLKDLNYNSKLCPTCQAKVDAKKKHPLFVPPAPPVRVEKVQKKKAEIRTPLFPPPPVISDKRGSATPVNRGGEKRTPIFPPVMPDKRRPATPLNHPGEKRTPLFPPEIPDKRSAAPLSHGGEKRAEIRTPFFPPAIPDKKAATPLSHGGEKRAEIRTPLFPGAIPDKRSANPLNHGGEKRAEIRTPLFPGAIPKKRLATPLSHGGEKRAEIRTPLFPPVIPDKRSATPLNHGGEKRTRMDLPPFRPEPVYDNARRTPRWESEIPGAQQQQRGNRQTIDLTKNDSSQEVADLKKKIEELQQKNEGLRGECATINARRRRLSEENEELKAAEKLYDNHTLQHEAENRDLSRRLREAETEVAELRTRVEAAAREAEAAAREAEESGSNLEKLQARFVYLETINKDLKANLARAEKDKLDERRNVEELTEKLARLIAERDEYLQAVGGLEVDVRDGEQEQQRQDDEGLKEQGRISPFSELVDEQAKHPVNFSSGAVNTPESNRSGSWHGRSSRPVLGVVTDGHQESDDEMEDADGPVTRKDAAQKVMDFDKFMGIPENLRPAWKKGELGFREGKKGRTGSQDRGAEFHPIVRGSV